MFSNENSDSESSMGEFNAQWHQYEAEFTEGWVGAGGGGGRVWKVL